MPIIWLFVLVLAVGMIRAHVRIDKLEERISFNSVKFGDATGKYTFDSAKKESPWRD